MGFAQDGRLFLAGWTPRCEERDPDGLAAAVRERDRLPVEVEERSRCTIRLATELRRDLAECEAGRRFTQLIEAGAGYGRAACDGATIGVVSKPSRSAATASTVPRMARCFRVNGPMTRRDQREVRGEALSVKRSARGS